MASGAWLKTTLQGLGLPPVWFAEYFGVTKRTVVRWCDSPDPLPDLVVRAVEHLAAEAGVQVDREIQIATVANGETVLRTYRTDADAHLELGLPASWFRAATFRAERILRDQGRAVRIEYV